MSTTLTYDVIKKNLFQAGRMVDEGKLDEADDLIRSMVGRGMTLADIDANLTQDQITALRKHTKGKK